MKENLIEKNADCYELLKSYTSITQIPTSILITNSIGPCDFYRQLDLIEESKFKS